jgi:transposase
VPNAIAVPAEARACPRCGKERTCIGHDTTEVIDLIPAQVIVRVDQREKLACEDCDAEVVRAPVGDKVVEGGKYGDALVIDMLVSKYADGAAAQPPTRTIQAPRFRDSRSRRSSIRCGGRRICCDRYGAQRSPSASPRT